MTNITDQFNGVLTPSKAFLVYENNQVGKVYVESYDIDDTGRPINAHPLSKAEVKKLRESLDGEEREHKTFYQSKGILSPSVLYIGTCQNGSVVWHTPAMKAQVFFKDELTVPSGVAWIPALLWKATQYKLTLFALQDDLRPQATTPLYCAPFFNMFQDGNVCFGTVNIDIKGFALEEFIEKWQSYFFNSYFSHSIDNHNTITSNLVQLWTMLVNSGKPFPLAELKKSKCTLTTLLK